MDEIVPNSSRGSGNTKTDPPKQISPAKKWCFTFNNYTKKDIDLMIGLFEKDKMAMAKFGLMGEEVGENGTPHLQGYVEFIRKIRPKNYFTCKIHWEKARGSRADNVLYCQKDQKVIWDKGVPLPIKVISPDYDWEKEILEIVKKEPDDRKIYWYYGEGNVGKTSFCKYLTVKHGAICLSGLGSDMRNGIVEYVEKNGETPKLVVINIPKCKGTKYLSYEGIENIKDMYFYSGKYKGGMVCGNPPHLFVFANELPELEKMSEDRWEIENIAKVPQKLEIELMENEDSWSKRLRNRII